MFSGKTHIDLKLLRQRRAAVELQPFNTFQLLQLRDITYHLLGRSVTELTRGNICSELGVFMVDRKGLAALEAPNQLGLIRGKVVLASLPCCRDLSPSWNLCLRSCEKEKTQL